MSSDGMGVAVLVVKVVVCGKFLKLELWHLIDVYERKVGLLVVKKLFCNGYKGAKRHGGLGCSECSVPGSGLVVDLVVVCSFNV